MERFSPGDLQTVVSVSLCAAKLPGGFQCIGSVALNVTESLGGLLGCVLPIALCTKELLEFLQALVSSGKQTSLWSVAQLPCEQQISWDASGCVVSYPTALSAEDLLGWLRIWYLHGSRLASSLPHTKCIEN